MSNLSTAKTLRKRRKTNIKKTFKVWLLLFPVVFLLYLFIWRPSVMGMVWSLFKMKGYTPTEFIGLQNYVRVISNTEFLPILWNTVQYVLWSIIIGFPLPIIVAFAVNEMVHFKNGFRNSIYLPAIMPGITVMLLWYFIYSPTETGLFNQILGAFGIAPYGWLNDPNWVILYIIIQKTWAGFPASMFFYYTSIQNIPGDLYEAATIDGAGFFRRLWNVAIPRMLPIIVLNLVRQIIGVFQVMQEPMVLTGGGPNNASMSLGYQVYLYGFVQNRVGQALALGTITFLILIFATLFYFKIEKKTTENL